MIRKSRSFIVRNGFNEPGRTHPDGRHEPGEIILGTDLKPEWLVHLVADHTIEPLTETVARARATEED